MSRTVHLCLDIAGALKNWSDGDFATLFKHDDGSFVTAAEAKSFLFSQLAIGVKVIPFGHPCVGFDYEGGGCPGHETEQGRGVTP